MGIIIGIDIGGSTTKIIGLNSSKVIKPMLIRATDPIASLFGAFGKFLYENKLSLNEISQVMVTGVGRTFIEDTIFGLPTEKVDEFLCNGLGGLSLSKLSKALIVSMGTGTAIVSANGLDDIKHIGGTGVGGGTILGLCKNLISLHSIDLIVDAAKNGDLSKIDLTVGDITNQSLVGLDAHVTASNFGKISDLANTSDIALGVLNLVFQTIGISASFAIKNTDYKDVILIGSLTSIPQCKEIFDNLSQIFKINFIIPEMSEYATALGAALSYENSYV